MKLEICENLFSLNKVNSCSRCDKGKSTCSALNFYSILCPVLKRLPIETKVDVQVKTHFLAKLCFHADGS